MNLPAFETTADGKKREHLEPQEYESMADIFLSPADLKAKQDRRAKDIAWNRARVEWEAIGGTADDICEMADHGYGYAHGVFSRLAKSRLLDADFADSDQTFAASRAAETETVRQSKPLGRTINGSPAYACTYCGGPTPLADQLCAGCCPLPVGHPIPHDGPHGTFADEMRLLGVCAAFVLVLIVVFIAFNLC